MQKQIDYAILGKRIKEIRINKHITQEALAELVGCNPSHISNVENHFTTPSLNVLLSIANALNTSIDSLLLEQYNNSSDSLLNEIIERVKELDTDSKQKLLKIIDILNM